MTIRIIQGDVRDELPRLPADFFDCIVTSPPYFGLRDYGCAGQIGLEPTLGAYLETMVAVCRELRRVLKPSGVFFLNIGDSYSNAQKIPDGLKPKNLMLVPQRIGILLQQDGWWVRSQIIWHKTNPMPESITDRPTSAHETIWMLTKGERYYWDAKAVEEDSVHYESYRGRTPRGKQPILDSDPDHSRTRVGFANTAIGKTYHKRNIRNVWPIALNAFIGAHFATMPPEIAERCIKASCPPGGRVLDPFGGAGTTGLVADRLGRDCTMIDLNTEYMDMAANRIKDDAPLFVEIAAE